MLNVGDFFSSNNYGEASVVSVDSASSVLVRFTETGYECVVTMDNAMSGRVKDKLKRSILGFGFIGIGSATSTSKAYVIWRGMIQRCYSVVEGRNHHYTECSVCDEWRDFQVFAKWYNDKNPEGKDLQLDKDILLEGNKHYSPEKCLLVTQQLNKKFKTSMQTNNTSGFKGVSFEKKSNKWVARVTIGNKKRHRVGLFESAEDANKARLEYMKQMSERNNALGEILRKQNKT